MGFDYEQLHFKCGLEIHQQLEGKKLFCDCPTLNSSKESNFSFKRRLRAVAGESGKIDQAALHEMTKDREMTYIGHSEDCCLVEFDEEPPHSLNSDALTTALQVAKFLNMHIVDEIQFMRKTVIDGSNVSGFQRTGLIATNGTLETSKGSVIVESLCLEEEAAQKVSSTQDTITYKLDRLGIPLLEIATDASIKDPEHAKEVASLLGMILRSTGSVKRGLGTIRQDVNVSIKGGVRTEIKGFQDLKSIPKVVNNEIQRQLDLIQKKETIEKAVRKAEPDFSTSFLRPMPGAARMYPETDVLTIPITKKMLDRIEIPELISVRIEKMQSQYGISEIAAQEIIKNEIDLDYFARTFNTLEAGLIAKVLIDIPKDLKSRKKLAIEKLTSKQFEEVLGYLNTSKVTAEAVPELLTLLIEGKSINLADFAQADESELESAIEQIIKEKPGLSPGGYMGLVMGKFRGKVDGKKVMEILKKKI